MKPLSLVFAQRQKHSFVLLLCFWFLFFSLFWWGGSMVFGVKQKIEPYLTSVISPGESLIKTDQRLLQRWLLKKPSPLTEEYVTALKTDYSSASISPRAMVTGSVSLRVGAVGQSFVTDILLYGVEAQSLEKEYQRSFQNVSTNKIPVLASQFWGQTIKELVLSNPEDSMNLEVPALVKKIDAQFILGQSTFIPSDTEGIVRELDAELRGLSQKIHPLGLAIPLESAREIHESLTDEPFDYDEIVVKASPAIIEKIKKELPEGSQLFGYGEVLSPYQQMGQFLLGLLIIFWLVSSVLVWVLLGFFLDLFWQKNQQAIFSLHALGLSRWSLFKLVMTQQTALLFLGGFISFILFYFLRTSVQDYFFPLEGITYWQEDMFASPELYWYWGALGALWTLLFMALLCFFKIYREDIAGTLR